MCGIAGIVLADGQRPDRSLLDRMGQALSHRGPDGSGVHIGDGIGLVHTRLSIIDIEGGRQPLYLGDRVLIANGEIYNYLELARALPDVTRATDSDCELPLHLHAGLGADCIDELRGMYGLALWDSSQHTLLLARDPFGIKPLFYTHIPGGLIFASEVQALFASGLLADARTDPVRAEELLMLQFTTGADSIYSAIKRVLPGETLIVREGVIGERKRRAAVTVAAPEARTEAAALARLDACLEDAVTVHQRADVPYGMFLSGGIDSATILAMMARLNDTPVMAFTAGFSGTGVHDEREQAKAVAKATGAQHIELDIDAQMFAHDLPMIIAGLDDPTADYAVIPTWYLAREASKHVKVVLSGEGGDELFGGYSRYRKASRPWPFTRPMRRRGKLSGLGLLRDETRWGDGFHASGRNLTGSLLQRAQAQDMADWLAHDLLTKLDRMLMRHGVEGRVPFLDPVVASFAFNLPDRLKKRGRLGKWLLRLWLQNNLPQARAMAPKQGFTVPVGHWIDTFAQRIAPLIANQPGIVEICHPESVTALFTGSVAGAAHARWVCLFYALWHQIHIRGADPQGNIEDVLAWR